MDVRELLVKFKEVPEFKEWHYKHPDAKPVHVFLMLDPELPVKYDVGFFDFKREVMSSFIVDEKMEHAEVTETKEIFTKDNQRIKPLEEERVKIGFKEAFEVSRKLQQEKYKQHEPLKEVVILQNLAEGQVWNITYITQTFQTLNIKVDAETGNVVEDKLHQIFSFDK